MSRSRLADVAGLGAKIVLHIPFQVAVVWSWVEVVEERDTFDSVLLSDELEVSVYLSVNGTLDFSRLVKFRSDAKDITTFVVGIILVLRS